jgi:small-conductance mechanosensitive channel
VEGFGIRFVGINAENAQKLLLTGILILVVWILRFLLRRLMRFVQRQRSDPGAEFWTRQAINIGTTVLLMIGLLSIWFDDPTRLATALGLVTAGLAFALQRVVTAIAGYLVILRGNTFSVGERITMGGVRGDVIGLGFIQTTIMEMGQPPTVQGADPAMWVRSRQYTGRIVTVTNDKIFEEAVYNYTRDFPYLWEEISLPISYAADRGRVEQILLDAARRHTMMNGDQIQRAMDAMMRRYFMQPTTIQPRVYYRLTDNWLELTVRFLVEDRGVRDVKDAMSREILEALDAAGIGLASATFEIVGIPSLKVSPENGRPE